MLGLYGIALLKYHYGKYLDVDCCDVDGKKRGIITNLGATFKHGKQVYYTPQTHTHIIITQRFADVQISKIPAYFCSKRGCFAERV